MVCICFRSELQTVTVAVDRPNMDMEDHFKGENKKRTSLCIDVADIVQSPDFSTRFEGYLDKCGDVNAGHKNGKTLLHYIAKYVQASSNMSSRLRPRYLGCDNVKWIQPISSQSSVYLVLFLLRQAGGKIPWREGGANTTKTKDMLNPACRLVQRTFYII